MNGVLFFFESSHFSHMKVTYEVADDTSQLFINNEMCVGTGHLAEMVYKRIRQLHEGNAQLTFNSMFNCDVGRQLAGWAYDKAFRDMMDNYKIDQTVFTLNLLDLPLPPTVEAARALHFVNTLTLKLDKVIIYLHQTQESCLY